MQRLVHILTLVAASITNEFCTTTTRNVASQWDAPGSTNVASVTLCTYQVLAGGKIELPGVNDVLVIANDDPNSHTGVTAITDDTFSNLKNLKTLIIDRIVLGHLEVHAFRGLENLERLILNRDELTAIPPAVFSDLTNLKELDLRFNKIKRLQRNMFEKLTNLQSLSLAGNEIEFLPSGWETGLSDLRRLAVSGNHMQVVSIRSFYNLAELRSLRLGDPGLRIERNAFEGLDKLEDLVISGNPLDAKIQVDIVYELQFMPNLKSIALRGGGFECDTLSRARQAAQRKKNCLRNRL